MEPIKLSRALSELDDQELRAWLMMHEWRMPRSDSIKHLSTFLRLEKEVAFETLHMLRAKRYILFEDTKVGTKKVTLLLRLDVSSGCYARF